MKNNNIKNYYPETIARFREVLINKNPGIIPEQKEDRNSPSHLLWMLDETEKGGFGLNKASRWLGWIACSLYLKDLISSEEIDNLIRKDIKN